MAVNGNYIKYYFEYSLSIQSLKNSCGKLIKFIKSGKIQLIIPICLKEHTSRKNVVAGCQMLYTADKHDCGKLGALSTHLHLIRKEISAPWTTDLVGKKPHKLEHAAH